jgi:hypothetical protein
MGKVDRAKFKKDAERGSFRGGAKYLNLKTDKIAKGHLHPQFGLYERFSHGSIPVYETFRTQEGGSATKMKNRRYNCLGEVREEVPNQNCPVCLLQEFSVEQIAKGADKAEVILEARDDKGQPVTSTLSTLSGDAGYRGDPKAKQEVAFVWIPEGAKATDNPKESIQIATGPQSLGTAMIAVIDSEVENRGELKGNLEIPEGYDLKLRKGKLTLVNGQDEHPFDPFALKLKYDPKADPSLMYKAEKLDRDLVPVTDDVVQLMLATAEELDVNLERMCSPDDPDEMMRGIESAWTSRSIPFEVFSDYVESKTGSKPAARSEAPASKPAASKTESKPAETGGFCKECGNKLGAGAKFCQRCGSPQDGSAATPAPASKPAEDTSIDSKPVRVKCEECGEDVELMVPSFRCELCGHVHSKLKAQMQAQGDVPF